MTTLYELQKDLYAILSRFAADELNDEERAAAQDSLEATLQERDIKISNCCALIKNWEADLESFDVEIKRLREKKALKERKIERLTNYVQYCLSGQAWSNAVHKVAYRTSTAVEVADDANLPDPYVRIIREPDKATIKKDLLNGASIPGCVLVHRNNISIK